MKHLLRSALLIVLAMLGCGVLLAGLMMLAMQLTIYEATPADYLSAEKTIAVLHHPSGTDIQLWSAVWPSLKDIETPEPEAVAVLRLRDGKTASVALTVTPDAAKRSMGPFAVSATDTRVIPLLGKGNALSKLPAYAAFAVSDNGNSWTYVSRDAFDPSVPQGVLLLSLIAGSAPGMQISLLPDQLQIRTEAKDIQSMQTQENAPNIDHAVLTVSVADADAAWNALLAGIDRDTSVIVASVLRSQLARYGDSISPAYDILPLLKRPAVLQMTASGAHVGVVLSGSDDDKASLRDTLERWHQSYLHTLPAATVTHRILDARFASTDIREDASAIVQKQEQRDGWLVQITRPGNSDTGLFTATKGKRFLVATAQSILMQAMADPEPIVRGDAQAPGIIRSIGVLNADGIKRVSDAGIPLPKSVFGTGTLLWESSVSRGVRDVYIQTNRRSAALLKSLLK